LSSQPRHFVLHIPNTPPHHHLCSRKTKTKQIKKTKKTQIEKDPTAKKKLSTKEKNPNLRKKTHREMPDQSYMTPNISYKFEKQRKEMVFSLKKNKNNYFHSPNTHLT
jgi:hypothetical protein